MAVTHEMIKSVAKKHLRNNWSRTNVPVGANLTQSMGSNGIPQYGVENVLGNTTPDEDVVDGWAEVFADIFMDVIPLLQAEVDVVITTGSGTSQGKGSGGIS